MMIRKMCAVQLTDSKMLRNLCRCWVCINLLSIAMTALYECVIMKMDALVLRWLSIFEVE